MKRDQNSDIISEIIEKFNKNIKRENLELLLFELISKSSDEHDEFLEKALKELLTIGNPNIELTQEGAKRAKEIAEEINSLKFNFFKKEQFSLQYCIYAFNLIYRNLTYKLFADFNAEINKLKDVEEETIKMRKILSKIKKKFLPEDKKDISLIRHFIKVAYTVKKYPTLDQLDSDNYSKASWGRKLKELGFLYLLIEEVKKRLNKKSLTKSNKEILIEIKNIANNNMLKNQSIESKKSGVKNRNKPDFNDFYSENEENY